MGYLNVGNGPALAATNITCLVLTWILAPLRVYVRLCLVKSWKLEDWLFVATQVFFTGVLASALISAVNGVGQNLKTVLETGELETAMKYWYICEVLQTVANGLMRLSLGFFLVRLCTARRYLYTVYATIGLSAANTVATFFCTTFQCNPVNFFWLQFSGAAGACLPAKMVQDIAIGSSAIVVVVDMIFGILPIFLIWNLQMNRKAKIIAGCLLAVGIIAGGTVIVRIELTKNVNLDQDFLFAISDVAIWSMAEPCIGICCLSIVTYRPLFKSLADKSTYGSASGANSKDISGLSSRHRKGSSVFQSRGARPTGKSWQMMSTENDDNGDSLPLGPLNKVHIRAEKNDQNRGQGIIGNGIQMDRTVEVTREQRVNHTV